MWTGGESEENGFWTFKCVWTLMEDIKCTDP